MHALRAVNDEPIPGYRLLEPLGKGGFGEVWKCQAPGGLIKAIKFVAGHKHLDAAYSDAEQELRALEHIKSLRHPFLLSIERVEIVEGDLTLVTELADRSLHDLLTEYRQAGHPGIPRAEVLAYFREAAEVLDLMHQDHGLQHLDIKPRNLFLVGRHIKVADFGLVASLAETYTRDDLLTGITPLYAAPEIFEGRATLNSDQYSLAVTYLELMTGELPYKARTAMQLAYLVSTTEPDLTRIPKSDRPAVARALSKDPENRFASCTEFIQAIWDADPPTDLNRPRSTCFEMSLGDTPNPSPSSGVKRPSIFRRQPRVVSAGSTSTPAKNEGLDGYQLLECLTRGPTGELWRGRRPQQDNCLIRFLTPPNGNGEEPGPIDRLLGLRHEGLAELQRHPMQGDRIVLVSEAGDMSLANLLRDCRATAQPGIPREELLGYYRAIALALDELYHVHQLQHLALTPRHLALSNGSPILIEFGFAELLWLSQGLPPASFSPRYASPELFEGLISDACDQYSLALMFPELLVGMHPYRTLTARQLASPKLRGQPDLSLLSALDREIVARAIDPQPDQRFRSCSEFVLALEDATVQSVRETVVVPANECLTRPLVLANAPTQVTVVANAEGPESAQCSVIEELVQVAALGHEVRSAGQVHYRLSPGRAIEQRSLARLASGMARLKLSSFREQWQAEVISRNQTRWLMEIRTQVGLLQRWLGRVPGLAVELVFGTPRGLSENLTPVRITIEPLDCAKDEAGQILTQMGVAVLTSLQTALGCQVDLAAQERFPAMQLVQVADPCSGVLVTGQLRDLGRQGLTVRAIDRLPIGPVIVTINRKESSVLEKLPARVQDCFEINGKFEIELEFVE